MGTNAVQSIMEFAAEGNESAECTAALALWQEKLDQVKIYGGLTAAVAGATAVALIVFVFLIVAGENVEAGVSALSGVVSAGATVFLFNKKSEANKDAEEFLAKIRTACPTNVQQRFDVPAAG